MTDQQSLWEEVERILSHHQKASDPTSVDALNRLFREHFGKRKDFPTLGKDNCWIYAEKLSWEKLDQIKRKDRETKNPRHTGDPIVAVAYGGARYLIDGRRRVNRCIYERWQDPLTVLFIEYRGG